MTNPRRFLLKVNASECPDEVGQPDNIADWEGKSFQAGKPQATSGGMPLPPDQVRDPDPGDYLLIWINDGREGGGTGLTGIGEVSVFDPDTLEVVVKSIELFPPPRLNRADLGNPGHHPALHNIAVLRTQDLRYIGFEDWDAVRDLASKKVANSASAYLNVTTAEGKRIYSESVKLERDPELRKAVMERNKWLYEGVYHCQACAFSANQSSLFDAHHLVPLCRGPRQTGILAFAVLCPTCHRLAHRLGSLHDPLPVSDIRSWWQKRTAREGGVAVGS